MEMNPLNTMKDFVDQWLDLPQKMADTAHKTSDPVFEMLDVMMKTQKNIQETWEKNFGKSNVLVKWPIDMIQSAFDYRYFYDSFEKASESLQTALKDEIDYWFDGQKKLRQSLIKFPK